MKIKFLAIIAILLLSANLAGAADTNSGDTNLKSNTSELKPEVPNNPGSPTIPKPPKKKLAAFGWHKSMDPEAKALCKKQFPESRKDYARCVKRKTREKQKED